MNGVLRHLRRLALPCDGTTTDTQLLERFLATRDEAAFEAIVRRHGPMVMGCCRRLLPGVQDAEDAFQATFLILVHKAASVTARDAVGSWLYGVACRTAQKARVAAARQRTKEMQMARPEAQQAPDDFWRELRPVIDEELNRLPEKYRAGRPVRSAGPDPQAGGAAARLSGRHRVGPAGAARGMLAKRLARRGLALSATAWASSLSQGAASAAVRVPLVQSTITAATRVAAGHATAGVVSAPVAALIAGVLKSMAMSKLKLMLAALLAVGLLGTGWSVYSSGAADNPKQLRPPPQAGGGGGGGIGGQAPAQEKINLPSGPTPVQVLASIDQEGKLVIKRALTAGRPVNGPGVGPGGPPAAPPAPGGGVPGLPGGPGGVGGPGGGGRGLGGAGAAPAAAGPMFVRIQTQIYDLDSVEVFDTNATKLDRKELQQRLKGETVALATWVSPLDPLHLRVVKDGTLIFVLPNLGGPGALPPGAPRQTGPGGGAPGGAIPPPPAQLEPGGPIRP